MRTGREEVEFGVVLGTRSVWFDFFGVLEFEGERGSRLVCRRGFLGWLVMGCWMLIVRCFCFCICRWGSRSSLGVF